MVKGPAGGPRPFAKHQIVFDPQAMRIFIVNTGPFGGPRPFSMLNPEVEDDRIRECVISSAGTRFGAGSVSSGPQSNIDNTTDITDLPPEEQLRAIVRAEKWCEGILDSTSEANMSAEEINERFNDTVEALLDEVDADVERPELLEQPPEEVEVVSVE